MLLSQSSRFHARRTLEALHSVWGTGRVGITEEIVFLHSALPNSWQQTNGKTLFLFHAGEDFSQRIPCEERTQTEEGTGKGILREIIDFIANCISSGLYLLMQMLRTIFVYLPSVCRLPRLGW